MKTLLAAALAAIVCLPAISATTVSAPAASVPRDGMIKVAFMVSDDANVIDIGGPWEVFQDTMVSSGKDGKHKVMPYELYTIGPSHKPLHTEGGNRPGMTFTPDYSYDDAPMPDIIVVGAQSGAPGLGAWLQKAHAQGKTIVSICTGAFLLGETGLLKGKQATTHHWYFGDFARQFPDTKLVREVRYVDADPITFTAGGLSSGVDLALHLVAHRFGDATAQQTADYIEYQGTGWKTNQGIAAATAPVTHVHWSGQLTSQSSVVLHQITTGWSTAITAEIPAEKVASVPVTETSTDDRTTLLFAIPGHPATFTGKASADGHSMTGTFVQNGTSYPLTLRQGSDAAE
ncbi:GlxA family transcriptional regulator [Dyella acidisoli]|uniref:DJ-1/PfpI domain-containing protein n=1 Tax=Dyella acidisoli TaxID=1867834 RepID=A0ABQ5XJZ6_9GAMM|nr:DJ-1/PfpI family protein [Dyella acidisoli]GLQ91957.1 hypothetical protein GCM10007901_09080 [Dyella acidisoli]